MIPCAVDRWEMGRTAPGVECRGGAAEKTNQQPEALLLVQKSAVNLLLFDFIQ